MNEGWRLIGALMNIALLVLEAVGKFQLIGFGVGDWKSLG